MMSIMIYYLPSFHNVIIVLIFLLVAKGKKGASAASTHKRTSTRTDKWVGSFPMGYHSELKSFISDLKTNAAWKALKGK